MEDIQEQIRKNDEAIAALQERMKMTMEKMRQNEERTRLLNEKLDRDIEFYERKRREAAAEWDARVGFDASKPIGERFGNFK